MQTGKYVATFILVLSFTMLPCAILNIPTVVSSNSSITLIVDDNEPAGIVVVRSFGARVRRNTVTANSVGIIVTQSQNTTVSENRALYNGWGIYLFNSRNCTIQTNTMADNAYNFGVNGSSLPDFSNTVDSSNTVNQKNVYYLIDQRDLQIDPLTYPNLGYLALINSSNIVAQNLKVTQNWSGVLLVNTNNSRIGKVHAAQNYGGIIVHQSRNVTVEKSIASGNTETGIYVGDSENSTIISNTVVNQTANSQTSSGIELTRSKNVTITQNKILNNRFGMAVPYSNANLIYWNNFIGNAYSVTGASSAFDIMWDNGYPSGGNHWSDYAGEDTKNGANQDMVGSDGIGDTPHIIDSYNLDRYPLMVPTESYISSVPFHFQDTDYFCGPAALQMVFDFYGPDISQIEIADAARTARDGTYTSDMVRASHFSNLSTSVGNEMPGNITGYTARTLGYGAFEYGGMTMPQLKSLLAGGYPIIVLTTWHYRVAVGYSLTHITFQDSWYGPMYNMTWAAFDRDWDYSSHWALFISPWKVEVSVPNNATVGEVFNITATVAYPLHSPFYPGQYTASQVNATIGILDGLSLVSGEIVKKIVSDGNLVAGNSANVEWKVQALSSGNLTVSVEVEAGIEGYVPPLPSYPQGYNYADRIGGAGQVALAVTWADDIPPATSDDYDDMWHNADFTITLLASDDLSGVAKTRYRINDGPVENVTTHGQPLITAEGANNTLEYWSIDHAGNEETHHLLVEIKLDKTTPSIGTPSHMPDDPIFPSQEVKVSVNVEDTISGVKNVTLCYSLDNGTTWQQPTLMTFNASANEYETTIPPQDAGKRVTFRIFTYDNAGNQAVNDNAGQYYVYLVVPEYPQTFTLPLLVALALLVVAVKIGKDIAKLKTTTVT